MNYIFKYFVLTSVVFISTIVGEVKGVSAETSSISTQDTFVVRNISIDVTADSAKNARDKAFIEAQQKSLPILIQQLEAGGYNTDMIKRAEPESLANAIKDFEILNEKISAVRYKGDFVFRYDENLLSHYFYNSKYGLPTDGYSEYQQSINPVKNESVLVLPFFQDKEGAMVLWDGYNPWKDVWASSSTKKIIAPIGDLYDIRDISDNEALTYNPEKLANMAERYNADRVIILIGSHDGEPLPTDVNQSAIGVFKMSIYDTARGRPNFIGDVQIEEGAYSNFSEALKAAQKRAIEKISSLNSVGSIGIAEQSPYTYTPYEQSVGQPSGQLISNVVPSGMTSSFQARIEYTSMQEWIKAQKKLRSVNGVSNIEVLSLTSEQAEIKIHFSGQFDDMATDMVRKGYNIRQTSKVGRYVIYSDSQSAFNENGGIVYR